MMSFILDATLNDVVIVERAPQSCPMGQDPCSFHTSGSESHRRAAATHRTFF